MLNRGSYHVKNHFSLRYESYAVDAIFDGSDCPPCGSLEWKGRGGGRDLVTGLDVMR